LPGGRNCGKIGHAAMDKLASAQAFIKIRNGKSSSIRQGTQRAHGPGKTRRAAAGNGKGRINPPGFALQHRSSPLQPRKTFRPEELAEMVDSIKERGIIQPLIVRLVNGKYELIAASAAGARRAKRAWKRCRHRARGEQSRRARTGADRESPARQSQSHRGSRGLCAADEGIHADAGAGRAASREGRAVVANAVRLLTLPEQIKAWIGSAT